MTDDCEHEWRNTHLTDGRPARECTRCPAWRVGFHRPSRDPEITRKAMEETSRYLGEHRD